MTILNTLSAGLLVASLAAGTWADRPPQRAPVLLGGYHVLAVDLHVHPIPLSASTLAPWDLAIEARRQGLDAIAITGHNEVLSGKVGRWFAQRVAGVIVLDGEEITAPGYHLIAAGIHSTISWRLTAAQAIEEAHRQGGVAIAAHPTAGFWPAYDPAAMAVLDGSEVMQPAVYSFPNAFREMQEFARRKRMAHIGSSDYHGIGPLGLCRTYVFAREATEDGVLEPVRAGRTVVFDRDGQPLGDPAMIALSPRDDSVPVESNSERALSIFSRICGLLGMLGVALAWRPRSIVKVVQN